MKSTKGNLLGTFLMVVSLNLLAGCGGDPPANPAATSAPASTATSEATSTPVAEAWQPYTSTEGRFSILMPGQPSETSQVANSALGEFTTYFTKYEEDGSQYLVSYADYPEGTMTGSNPEEVVAESFAKTFESAPDANKVVKKSKITVQGFPGMEGEIEYTSGNYVWYKTVLVNDRQYQVLATTPTADKDQLADDASKFQASFEMQDLPPVGDTATPTTEASTGNADGWQTVTSAEGNFSILMPGQPEEQSSSSETAAGEITQYLFQYAKDGPEYILAYADYPPQTSEVDPVKLLADTITGAAQGSTVENQQMSTVQGKPAVSGEWKSNESSYTWYKAIIVGNRLYQLVVAASTAAKDQVEADVLRFMDSFELTSE